eukprot:Skav236666  [mRNA]  locus=scaffold338:177850:179676:+ [translate_table: standard]
MQFNLLRADWKTIQVFTQQAWMRHIFESEIDRPGWRFMPEIDLDTTRRIFAEVPEEKQLIAMYSLTGAYMMAGQTRHFTDSDGFYQFCQEEDSDEHRLLHCSHFQHVRSKHSNIVKWLTEHDPCYLRLPIVPKSPDWEADLWIQHQLPGPTYVMPVLAQLEQHPSDQVHTFYTDGSCMHATKPGYRIAGFAAVWHPPCEDHERIHVAQTCLRTQQLADTFQVLATGPCVGRQSVPRAELQAVLCIAQLELHAEVYTDSQYVIDIIDKLGYVCDYAAFHKWGNFDLLQSMWSSLQSGTLRLHKVKAHAWQTQGVDPIVTFHRMGNEQADRAAKSATQSAAQIFLPAISVQQHDEDQNTMREQLLFRYDMHLARAHRQLLMEPAQVDGHRSADFQRQQLMDWQIGQRRTFDWPEDMQSVFDASLWGSQHTAYIHAWWTMLDWDQSERPDDPGISWFELAVNFQIVTQRGLAINESPEQSFTPRYLILQDIDVPYTQQVFAFERTISQLHRLAGVPLPAKRQRHCKSTRILGLAHGKNGLCVRPGMPRQRETIAAIVQHFGQLPYGRMPSQPELPTLTSLVTIPVSRIDTEDMASGWLTRHARFRNHRRRR